MQIHTYVFNSIIFTLLPTTFQLKKEKGGGGERSYTSECPSSVEIKSWLQKVFSFQERKIG